MRPGTRSIGVVPKAKDAALFLRSLAEQLRASEREEVRQVLLLTLCVTVVLELPFKVKLEEASALPLTLHVTVLPMIC